MPLSSISLIQLSNHLNSEAFDKQTKSHDLNTELVCYSYPLCTGLKNSGIQMIELSDWSDHLNMYLLVYSSFVASEVKQEVDFVDKAQINKRKIYKSQTR